VASSATTLSNVLPNNLRKISSRDCSLKIGSPVSARHFGRGIPVAERKGRRSVSDQSRECVEVPVTRAGIVLMNLFSNQGVVDNIDFPMYAYARPAGDSGGASARPCDSPNSGLRLSGQPSRARRRGRIAARPRRRISFRSERSRLGVDAVANGHDADGLDRHFGCRRQGCDLLLANFANVVCFAAIRSLWRGKPVGLGSQIRVEHRVGLGEQSSLLLQGGILDPLTGEARTQVIHGWLVRGGIAATSVCRANRMDAWRGRTTVAVGRRRILQPQDYGYGRMSMPGRNDRY